MGTTYRTILREEIINTDDRIARLTKQLKTAKKRKADLWRELKLNIKRRAA